MGDKSVSGLAQFSPLFKARETHMQGLHVFDPQAGGRSSTWSRSSTTITFCGRSIVILESAFVRELTSACYASGRGRPSIDPEVYFRMLLVAFLYDIRSDRQLCEDVYYNLAYRWFCRLSLQDRVPDHSSLSRIRDRYGEDIFEALFRRIVEICRKRDLVAPQCRVMTDATLIAADAALDSLVHNDPEQARSRSRIAARANQGRRSATDTQNLESDSPQSHRPRRDFGPEARDPATTQVQSAPKRRGREPRHLGHPRHDRRPPRQSALSRAVAADSSSGTKSQSWKRRQTEAMARRPSSASSTHKAKRRLFRCGAAAWGTASI